MSTYSPRFQLLVHHIAVSPINTFVARHKFSTHEKKFTILLFFRPLKMILYTHNPSQRKMTIRHAHPIVVYIPQNDRIQSEHKQKINPIRLVRLILSRQHISVLIEPRPPSLLTLPPKNIFCSTLIDRLTAVNVFATRGGNASSIQYIPDSSANARGRHSLQRKTWSARAHARMYENN